MDMLRLVPKTPDDFLTKQAQALQAQNLLSILYNDYQNHTYGRLVPKPVYHRYMRLQKDNFEVHIEREEHRYCFYIILTDTGKMLVDYSEVSAAKVKQLFQALQLPYEQYCNYLISL